MNVILFVSDTFRHDNLSCYNKSTRVRTPRLDQFARQAFVFNNAYLGSFPTVPNRLDIMSGRFSFIDREWGPLPHDVVTLQQILGVGGVVTQMIIDNPHLLEMGYDYSRGFTGFEWIRGQESDSWKTAPANLQMPAAGHRNRSVDYELPKYLRSTARWKTEEDHFVARTVCSACEWLEENQDQEKFFLYVDVFDPHEPWDAPQHYVDLYDPGYQGLEIIYPQYDFWRNFLTPAELNHIRCTYMAEATMVDHWFGVLLDQIDELGMGEDTAVMFCSDHGFLFGEHDIIGKSLLTETEGQLYQEAIPMYDEIRRIPVMIRLPGQARGKSVNALVQAPDLMPTILEMAGVVSSEPVVGVSRVKALQCGMFFNEGWHFKPEDLHGRSLVPLMDGRVDRFRDLVVCSNTLLHHTPVLAKSAIVTEDGWCLHYAGKYSEVQRGGSMHTDKLIDLQNSRINVSPALYYLRDDPREQKNVIYGNEALAAAILHRYVAWLEQLGTREEHLAGRRALR